MDFLRLPEGQKRVRCPDISKTVGSEAVVHGHDAPGPDRLADPLSPGSVYSVKTAHRDQQHVRMIQGGQLLFRKLVAQIPQMGHGQAPGGEYPDGAGAPQGAVLIIVEGGDFPDGKGGLPSRQKIHPACGVVVKVLVAAIDGVSGSAQFRLSFHFLIGIGDDAVSLLLQQETGVSKPGDVH